MAGLGDTVTGKLLKILTSNTGFNSHLDALAQLEQMPIAPVTDRQIRAQNVSFELSDRNMEATYPSIYVYCDKISNLLTEKFRSFSGKAHMVMEVRLSQDRIDGLEKSVQLHVEAIARLLQQNQGDWGHGMFYAGGYEIAFGPVKHGGRNFVQIAKITFEVGASNN
jgi:hypothetical protein